MHIAQFSWKIDSFYHHLYYLYEPTMWTIQCSTGSAPRHWHCLYEPFQPFYVKSLPNQLSEWFCINKYVCNEHTNRRTKKFIAQLAPRIVGQIFLLWKYTSSSDDEVRFTHILQAKLYNFDCHSYECVHCSCIYAPKSRTFQRF